MAKTELETFRDIGVWDIRNLTQKEPSCFNGMVRVTKVRVTIEEVKEDDEVIRDRLRKLWAECDNHHHRRPLIAMAKKYGLDLTANAAHERQAKEERSDD